MSPVNRKFNHRPPVPLLWHQTKITEAFVAENSVTYGQVMTKEETFHLSHCDLQGTSLWFPYLGDHERATHTQATKYNKNKSDFSEDRIRKGTFSCGPIARSLWSLTISRPRLKDYCLDIAVSQVQATVLQAFEQKQTQIVIFVGGQ